MAVRIFALIIGVFISSVASAQYEKLIKPQDTSEINLYYRTGVLDEFQYVVDDEGKKNYKMKSYMEGRLLASVEYNKRIYYAYDENYRVIGVMDSVFKNEAFIVTEYKFKYDPDGSLQAVSQNGVNSTFSKRDGVIKETFQEAIGGVKEKEYLYTSSGKLKEVIDYDVSGVMLHKHLYNYSTTDILYGEQDVVISEGVHDSTVIIYQFDEKKRIEKKQIFNFASWYVSNEQGRNTHKAEYQKAGEYAMTYYPDGKLQSLKYEDPKDKVAYLYCTYKYNDLGLMQEQTRQEGIGSPVKIVHEYRFLDFNPLVSPE